MLECSKRRESEGFTGFRERKKKKWDDEVKEKRLQRTAWDEKEKREHELAVKKLELEEKKAKTDRILAKTSMMKL
jgi:hypothetical protein